MPVNRNLTITIDSGKPFYRITSRSFYTSNPSDHIKVINGQGAVNSLEGARYNYPGVSSVYITEDDRTCFAEKMFYFHRQVLRGIDLAHHYGTFPSFHQHFILWAITFKQPINDVFDLSKHASYFNVFPSMMINPSQDYEHLKRKRAEIQHQGYKGLRARSSREKYQGNIIVLFDDQSNNIQSIDPYVVEFRLIESGGQPFANPAQELLDFTAGEIRINAPRVIPNWRRVEFNH